jgi:hypothetical protein
MNIPLGLVFNACDLGFTRGKRFISKGIRFLTQGWKEDPSVVNHVFSVTAKGNVFNAEIVEALRHVTRHKLFEAYGNTDSKVAIFRPLNLTAEQEQIITKELLSDVGQGYPWWHFPLFAVDCLLFNEDVVARKLIDKSDLKVCSTKTACAFAKAGLFFGVKEWSATPDDMWDFCVNNPDKYTMILPLTYLRDAKER